MKDIFEACRLEKEMDNLLEHFKDHVATYEEVGGMQILTFGKPDTCMGRMNYIFRGGRMIVTGDYGDCIYWWSGRASLQFVSGCHIGYVFEKVTAHGNENRANSCGKYDWSSDIAVDGIREFFGDIKEDNDELDDGDIENLKNMENRLIGTSESYSEFTQEMNDLYDDIGKYYGDFWESSLWGCGQVIPIRNKYHLLGVKLAYEQLKEKGELE